MKCGKAMKEIREKGKKKFLQYVLKFKQINEIFNFFFNI